MRRALVVCICFFFSQRLQASIDTLSISEANAKNQIEVSFDAGAFPLSRGGNWDPQYSLRFAIGKQYNDVSVYGYLEYYYFKFGAEGGITTHFTRDSYSARRSDIALYGGGKFFRVISVGVGFLYTKPETVYYLLSDGTPYPSGGEDGFHFFYTLGLGYDISLSDKLFLPFGVYYSDGASDSATLLGIKMGVGWRF